MIAARVAAQAKVNLFLHVLGRELSGYHALETLFLRLDLADSIVVRVGGTARRIDCRGADVGPADQNLAFRAATAYAETTGWPSGFEIEVDKVIPVGGGLGGGSADAGAVLRALDAISPRPIGRGILELATALGADVPFASLDCAMALAWGRGERLLPLAPLPPRPVALVVPDFAVSTKNAFAWFAEARKAAPNNSESGRPTVDESGYSPSASLLSISMLTSWSAVSRLASNDLEPVVFARFPELATYAHGLRADGAAIAMLSGSGSTVFGVFDGEPATHPRAEQFAHVPGARLVMSTTASRVVGVERLE